MAYTRLVTTSNENKQLFEVTEETVEYKTISPACHTGAVKIPVVNGAYPKDWTKRQCDGCGDYAFCKKRLKSKLLRKA